MTFGVHPAYMLHLWVALGGDVDGFNRMWAEDRRTPADTWAQLMAVVKGDMALVIDSNPPMGPEFEALFLARS